MKLYTEEQVKRAIDIADDNTDLLEYSKILSELTPIELPSDEEIYDEATNWWGSSAFRAGAKWVIEQIKRQGK